MAFENVYLVSRQLSKIAKAEVDELKTKLGFELPVGYEEYVTTLGDGKFCRGLHVRTPSEVMDPGNLSHWKDGMIPAAIEDRLWEEPLLSDEEVTETIVFAETDEGDYFVACPSRPGELYEFPRHSLVVNAFPDGLSNPFDCLFNARETYHFPFFESKDRRKSEKSTQFKLKGEISPHTVWDAVDALSDDIRVAEGEPRKTERVLAFLPEVEGSVALEIYESGDAYFYISTHAKCEEAYNELKSRIEPLAVPK